MIETSAQNICAHKTGVYKTGMHKTAVHKNSNEPPKMYGWSP